MKKKKLKKSVIFVFVIILSIIAFILFINSRIKDETPEGGNEVKEESKIPTEDNQITESNQEKPETQESTNPEIDKNVEKEEEKKETQTTNENNTSKKEENKVNNNKTENHTANKKLSYAKIAPIAGTKTTIGTTSKGYEIVNINGITYIDGLLIANKTYGLPSNYVPQNTVEPAVGKTNTCNKCIDKTIYNAFKDMQSDAAALGLNLYISSGYRPYLTQQKIYNNYVARDGVAKADTYSSRAGHSEHQTGLCFDVNIINDTFANTAEGKWVNSNAYLYGFIIRYPKGKEHITGYKYESWHLRYVGTELSYKLYNNGNWISLEEYYGFTSEYQN